MTTRPIEMTDLSLSLSILMQEKAQVQRQMDDIAAEESDLRQRIHAAMQEHGYKTFEGNGLQLTRSNRKSVTVIDENALHTYLGEHGMIPDYMKFDLTAAKRDAAKNGWPGVEEVVTDVLSVKGK